MEESENTTPKELERAKKEKKARERLARPPKDRRETVIGPTGQAGPDVTIE